jgi:hypothetical protein
MDSVFNYASSSTSSSLGTSTPSSGSGILSSLTSALSDSTSTLMTAFSGLSDTLGTGLSSLVSTSNLGQLATLYTPTAANTLDVVSAIANGRAPRTAAISSTYDGFHQFLLRGLGDTMLFSGMMRGDNTSVFAADGTIITPTQFPGAGTNGLPTKQCSLCYYQCMSDYQHSQIGMCTKQQCQVCYVDTTSTSSTSTSTSTRRLLTIVPPSHGRTGTRLTPEQNTATTGSNSRPNILPIPGTSDATIAAMLANLNGNGNGIGTSSLSTPPQPAGRNSINTIDDAAAAFIASGANQINTQHTPIVRRQRNANAAAASSSSTTTNGRRASPIVGTRPSYSSSSLSSASATVAPSSMSPSCALCNQQCLARSSGNVARCSKTCITLCN